MRHPSRRSTASAHALGQSCGQTVWTMSSGKAGYPRSGMPRKEPQHGEDRRGLGKTDPDDPFDRIGASLLDLGLAPGFGSGKIGFGVELLVEIIRQRLNLLFGEAGAL